MSGAQFDDGAILALGREFNQLVEVERAAWNAVRDTVGLDAEYKDAHAAQDAVTACVDRIIGAKARTLEGIRVKAEAIAWCHSGELPVYLAPPSSATDIRLAESIVQDLLQSWWPDEQEDREQPCVFAVELTPSERAWADGFDTVTCDTSKPVRKGHLVVAEDPAMPDATFRLGRVFDVSCSTNIVVMGPGGVSFDANPTALVRVTGLTRQRNRRHQAEQSPGANP